MLVIKLPLLNNQINESITTAQIMAGPVELNSEDSMFYFFNANNHWSKLNQYSSVQVLIKKKLFLKYQLPVELIKGEEVLCTK